jgi:hypothetical protein
MLKLCVIFFLIVSTICSCSDSDSIQKESFVGRWKVTQATHDYEPMPEWEGSRLTIEQDKVKSGRYKMTDTRYDSIWGSHGIWSKSDANRLILDDHITAVFSLKANGLIISKTLPETGDICHDSICIPVVSGQWDFLFEREN